MKELLQLVIDLVKELPELAIWVLVIIFAYKVCVVGSVYGIIRYCVGRLHDVLVERKKRVPEVVEVDIRGRLDEFTITRSVAGLVSQIHRLKGIRSSAGCTYIHNQDIEWLREAIDEKLEREKKDSGQ